MYLITGLPRSGTSLMMRAVVMSSTLPYIYDFDYESRLRGNETDATYDPNPNGYWVTDMSKNHDINGKLLKVPLHRAIVIPEGDCQVILMKRNLDTVKVSYNRSFGTTITDSFLLSCQIAEDHLRSFAKITEVNFEDVIDNPRREFLRIKAAGWPITVAEAVKLVDPELWRNR